MSIGDLVSSLCLFKNVMPEEFNGVACLYVLSTGKLDLYKYN